MGAATTCAGIGGGVTIMFLPALAAATHFSHGTSPFLTRPKCLWSSGTGARPGGGATTAPPGAGVAGG